LRKILAALVAVLALGTVGFIAIEKTSVTDALLSTVSIMSTNGIPQFLGTGGKLLAIGLIVASVGLLIALFAKLFGMPLPEGNDSMPDFSGDEDMMMREAKAGKLSGMKKQAILEKYSVVVIGIKHRGGFDINIPLSAKIKAGDSVLLMGTPAALLRLERKK